jgi:3-oxoacyl-[acyl-carrier protein] reductase
MASIVSPGVATLVTGALGGLGTAIVRRLVADGRRVIGCDRRAGDLQTWLAGFSEPERRQIDFHAVDVTREEEVAEFARDVDRLGFEIEALVNNAGVQAAGRIPELETKIWDRVVRVNLYGTFHMTRAFSGGMIARGAGRIVNFASMYAFEPEPGQSPYAAAKGGIIGFTRASALELARHGITVNVLAPGLIMHDRLAGLFPDEWFEAVIKRVPLGRAGKPEEIAGTIAFLLSSDAAYITGQTIHVNGGIYIGS